MDNINDNQEEIINEKVELDSQDSETLNSEQSNVEENIEENNVSNLDEFKKLKEENMTFKDKNKKANSVFFNVFLILALIFSSVAFNTYSIDLEFKVLSDFANYGLS